MAAKNTTKVAPVVDGLDQPANIPAATEFSTSGAPRQLTDFDVDHPAVDNDPRKDTSLKQNKIDFNDPTLTEEQAVAKALGYPDPAQTGKD